ncbi:MAG: hypothetical protein DMD49_11465, partial [Gemmatimonadetes bacterium]
MTRGACAAAVLLALALPRRAGAQVDTSARRPPSPDTTARRDTTRDTLPRYLPVLPAAIPRGPLPRGARFTFTADSFVFSDTKTLSDLLARIPGVYVARGGVYGQAEGVLYGGRGPAALEVYWDGVPYLPLGGDSVYLDPARIPLAPLERVDVVVLPAALRVYLVTSRQQSTAPATEIGITTGFLGTAGYRAAFLKRWRSGLGLSLVADWNAINGETGSSSTPFHDVDLWLGAVYVPTPKPTRRPSWPRCGPSASTRWCGSRGPHAPTNSDRGSTSRSPPPRRAVTRRCPTAPCRRRPWSSPQPPRA